MLQKISFALVLLGLSGLATAAQPVYTGFFSDVAIKGYDTVAYFTQGEAVKGDDAFSHRWNDAQWHFASAKNRDLFAANPEQYAPQYGGYCAFAIAAKDDLVKVDPTAWSIVDDKLYLNYNQSIRKDWEGSQATYIPQGDRNWQGKLK